MTHTTHQQRPLAGFVYEAGTLRFVMRAFFKLGLTESAQNVTEHTFRVAMIAWMLAVQENADVNKCLKMALIHDMGEIRTQDQDWVSGQYVKADEHRAARDIFSGTPLEEETNALLEEYQQRQTLEARIVKDADRLDLLSEVREVSERGVKLSRHWLVHENTLPNDGLFTQSGRELAKDLIEMSPFDWPDQIHETAYGKIRQFGTAKNAA